MEPFDCVLALGLLHHLDDNEVENMMCLAYKALKPGGRLLTVDGVFVEHQNPVARFLIKQDRGQNVRNSAEYVSLANTVFNSVQVFISHKKWIPYTHCIMECTYSCV